MGRARSSTTLTTSGLDSAAPAGADCASPLTMAMEAGWPSLGSTTSPHPAAKAGNANAISDARRRRILVTLGPIGTMRCGALLAGSGGSAKQDACPERIQHVLANNLSDNDLLHILGQCVASQPQHPGSAPTRTERSRRK